MNWEEIVEELLGGISGFRTLTSLEGVNFYVHSCPLSEVLSLIHI